jgi:threo-3-hydroxy-L-aspartate ammonia-lyase
MLTFQMIQEAAARIDDRINHTPVMTSRAFNEASGKEVFFKCENLQRAGAFKFRGATNRILSLTDAEKRRGVIAVSSGNHAQAVALAAREVGVRAVVAIPADAPKMKVAAAREYGADIRFFDRLSDDREAFGRDIATRENLLMVPPYDDYLIMAGQATCGLELLNEVSDLEGVLTPCSGGGLFAGVSTAARAIRPSIRCFPVEPDTANDTQQSIAAGERVRTAPSQTIADGLRVQTPGALTFPITRANAERVLTVSDDEIKETVRFLALRIKIVVEPSGAAAAAAVFFRKLPADVKRVGVVLSGGNIDPESLVEILSYERGNG